MKVQLVVMTLATAALLEAPAIAGAIPPSAPGPIAGVGIPALLGLGYLYKKMRDRRA